MNAASALMGVLRVWPGAAAHEALLLRRPALNGAWLRQWLGGVEAHAVPARIGALFALCGSAQADTSRRALAVAADLPEAPAPLAVAQRLRVATVREHLQRFWLDAAGPASGTVAVEAEADAVYPGLPLDLLPASPLPRLLPALSGASLDAVLRDAVDWIDACWLGQPGALAATLAAFEAHGLDGPGGLERAWQRLTCDHPETVGAAWLRAVLALKPGLQGVAVADPAEVMLRWDDAAVLLRVAQQLRDHDDFAQCPHDNGQARECGPWLRLGDSGAVGGAGVAPRPLDAWTRLVMRWVDLARLLSSQPGHGDHWLRSGALRTGDDEGLAWTEMARGVLLHWVQLEPAALGLPRRVKDYRVLAPTEWHVHPLGALAQAVSRPGAHSRAQMTRQGARQLVAVFDPCVPMEFVDA